MYQSFCMCNSVSAMSRKVSPTTAQLTGIRPLRGQGWRQSDVSRTTARHKSARACASRELTSSVASGRAVEVSPAGEHKTDGGTYQSDDTKVKRLISRADVLDEDELRRGDHTGLGARSDDAAAALHDEGVGFQQRG